MYSNLLSDKECLDIIAKKCGTKDFEIRDKKIGPMSEKMNGFLGVHLSAKFDIMLQGQPTTVQFFIKQLPFDPNHIMNQLTTEARVYAREAFAYETLIGRGVQVTWAPTFYLFKDESLIVLDDLSCDGFTMSSLKIDEIDVAHCRLALREIAAFHAHTFHLEHDKTEESGRPYSLNEEFADVLQEGLFHNKPDTYAREIVVQGIKAAHGLIDVMPDSELLPRDQFKAKIDTCYEQIFPVIKPSTRFRNVVCHGDIWLNNLMFKYTDGQPTDCCLIDFQFVKYSVPAHDFMLFLHMNAPRAFILEHLEDLQKVYHQQLANELKKWGLCVEEFLPWDEFIETGKEQRLITHLVSVMYKLIVTLRNGFLAQLCTDTEMYRDFMFVDRTRYIIKEYHECDEYRVKITQTLEDLREELALI